MKKLSLKDLKFGNNEKLDRNQMKTLFGGVDDSHAPEPFDDSSGGGGTGGGSGSAFCRCLGWNDSGVYHPNCSWCSARCSNNYICTG